MWKRLLAYVHILAYAFTHFHMCKQVAAPPSFGVPVVSAFLLLHGVVGSGHALMEVMKGTAVSFVVVQLSSQLKLCSSSMFFYLSFKV